ncbi:MAG: FAD-dependent oxidoreductase [Chloroflexota bacterium]
MVLCFCPKFRRVITKSKGDWIQMAETLKTDVAIVGGGGAGLAAAVQAAEKGAKVLVLEKRRSVGGHSAMAGGFFAAESPAEKRRMIDAPKDELFKAGMDFHHWTIDPRILRAYVDISGDTERWLEEKGLNVEFICAMNPHYNIRTFHRVLGATVLRPLMKSCDELGVKILCQSPVKKLLTDAKGNVTGVLATTEKGELKVEAKSVIITTGGYGGNKKMLKKYCPTYSEDIIYIGLKEVAGDGLQMAIDIGAGTEGLGILHYWGPRFPGTRLVNLLNQRPEAIWINKNGERYFDEGLLFDMGLRGNVVDRQPGKLSYTVFDEKIKNNVIKDNIIGAEGTNIGIRVPKTGGQQWADLSKDLGEHIDKIYGVRAVAGSKWTDLPDMLKLEANRGNVKISNSWTEIAKWMGTSPAVLKATIDEYNSFCDQGHDATFVKDRRFLIPLRTPPFYAVKCYSHYPDTIGGIKINHRMEVLDKQDKPIPGLYAAGVCCGGWQSETYCFALTGSMFGFALNSGRIAADSAVKKVLKK